MFKYVSSVSGGFDSTMDLNIGKKAIPSNAFFNSDISYRTHPNDLKKNSNIRKIVIYEKFHEKNPSKFFF